MFCLYCGTNLPDEAVFCKNCGKRQDAVKDKSESNIAILPFPTPSGASIDDKQPPIGNVAMVRGTPSESTKFPSQNVAPTAANRASSNSPKSVPPAANPSLSLPPTEAAKRRASAGGPKGYHQESQPHTPYPPYTKHEPIKSPTTPAVEPPARNQWAASDGLKLASKLTQWKKITIISSLLIVAIMIFSAVVVPKLRTNSQELRTNSQASTPDNTLCSGDTSGSPMSSGKIDNSHPFHQDDGQAAQGDQGGFTPVTLCRHMAASSYAISFHATSPYISLYMYDSKHFKYEIDYDIYPNHISVVTYPGFSLQNAISVGNGTFSTADWHTYQIKFTSDSVRVLVDGTQVLSGSAGFTDDGSGDDLLLQSHQITMDQFSITRL